MKKLLMFLLIALSACSSVPSIMLPPSGLLTTYIPAKGIYVLDKNNGTITSAGIRVRDGNIRDKVYLSGLAWRIGWSDLELSDGNYDFTPLDIIVPELQALNQKLTMSLNNQPAYLGQNTPNQSLTFIDTDGVKRAGMWDSYCLTHYQSFVNALSNHMLPDTAAGGASVRFADHSVLAGLRGSICGQRSVRDDDNLPGKVSQLAGYSRSVYESAITQSIGFVHTAFPNTMNTVGFWTIKDSNQSPPLWQEIQTLLTGSSYAPWLTFFQENLWASANTADKNDPNRVVTAGPTTTFAAPLYNSQSTIPVFLQALQGWSAPFAEPSKALNGTPGDGMNYALTTFGAKYFELYITDIDNTALQTELTAWGVILQ